MESEAVRNRAAALLALAVAAACNSRPEQPDNGSICRAYTQQASRKEVIAQGTIVDVLGESEGRGGEHEGYLLKLDGDCDLLLRVETNLSITGPIPIRRREQVIVKGEYEYDAEGGVLHWTHHDPSARHVAGYVVIDNHTYW
jgi:hypothetical protein